MRRWWPVRCDEEAGVELPKTYGAVQLQSITLPHTTQFTEAQVQRPKRSPSVKCVLVVLCCCTLVWYVRPAVPLFRYVRPAAPSVQVVIFCFRPEEQGAARSAITNLRSVSQSPIEFYVFTQGIASFPGASVYDLDRLPPNLRNLEGEMAKHTSGPKRALMWVPLLHLILPTVDKVVVWDTDVFALTDVAQLWRHFDTFGETPLFGMAYEQQATYYNWWPEEGTQAYFPGFNDGVQLLELGRMRRSALYNSIVGQHHYAEWLPDKSQRFYSGGLGDQDFYAVLGRQHRELFYPLPCGWNLQLCGYWNRRLPDVRHLRCDGPVHMVHGNCDTDAVARLLAAPCGGAEQAAILAELRLPNPPVRCP